ncbi:hypothetical protein [Persephonella sp.]
MKNYQIEKIAEDILLDRVKRRKTIFYSQLAREINAAAGKKVIPERGMAMASALTEILHSICSGHVKKGRAMPGALVVSKKTGIPSDGFFRFASQLYNIKLESSEERKKFWKDQLEKLFTEAKD